MVNHDVLNKTCSLLHREIDLEAKTRPEPYDLGFINRKGNDPDCSIRGRIQDEGLNFEVLLDVVQLKVRAGLSRTLGYLGVIQARLVEGFPEKRRDQEEQCE